jgi:hypothetical protein
MRRLAATHYRPTPERVSRYHARPQPITALRSELTVRCRRTSPSTGRLEKRHCGASR